MVNPLWTGNLTAGNVLSTYFGFSGEYGDLDDTMFSYGGTNYTMHSGRGLGAGAGHLGQISEYGPFADSECIGDLRDRQSLLSELGRPGGL